MMQYRQLGNTGFKVSVLGVGSEYLKRLSTEQVKQIVSCALMEGVNYFDLVWSFPAMLEGFKQALDEHHKEACLVFHLGSCIQNGRYQRSRDPQECEKQLRKCLSQLGMDHAPILNIHYVPNLKVWQEINKKGILGLATRLKDEGTAKVISASIHDPEVVELAAATGAIDAIMCQVNLANHKNPKRNEALLRCKERGVGVVAMKPFAGGTLLQRGREVKIPAYKSGWKSMTVKVSESSTPLRLLNYVLNQPAVCTALTGVMSVEELRENISFLTASPEALDYKMLLE